MALKKNVFVLYCLLCLAPANTHGADVNGASFADAGNGRVDYHLAAATATGDCRESREPDGFQPQRDIRKNDPRR